MFHEVERLAARLIRKASRKNEPLEALAQTPEFFKFRRSLYLAIRKQFKYFIENPPNELEANDLSKWLDDNLPSFSEFIDPQDTFEYYKFAFMWGIKSQYQRFGLNMRPYAKKAADSSQLSDTGITDGVVAGFAWSYDGNVATFNLTNPTYIASLKDSANYLLNLSNIDQTTKNRLIHIVQDARLAGKTIQEVSNDLTDEYDDVSQSRAMTIARTESANSMGKGNYASMVQNGVTTKSWVTAGNNPCEICIGNEDDGPIPIDEPFSSGDMCEPAHPNDECYTEAGEIDLDSIDIWGGQ